MISVLKAAVFVALGILAGQVAWNYSISPIFGLPEITYFQTIGILFFLFMLRPTNPRSSN